VANTWAASAAERVKVDYDSWGCYDSWRNRVYVARKQLFLAYDIKSNAWSPIQGEGQPGDLGSCAHGAITYDPVGDAVLILLKAEPGIWVYSPAANAWSRAAPPPEVRWRNMNVNAFHDPLLNAHFYHLAGDSYDNGLILVYRYRHPPNRGSKEQ